MKTAIYQCAAGGHGLDQRLADLRSAIIEHQSTNDLKLDLVVCPELFSSGYNVGDQLIASADSETGPVFEAFAALASEQNVALCYGYPQKIEDKLYNAAAFIDSDGRLRVTHQKQLNSPGSFEEDFFTPGNSTTSITYCGVNIAIVICYEAEFPESIRNAAFNGAQLVVVPTALVAQWDIVASCVIPTRAFENGVWIAYANHAGHENGFNYLGGSKIVSPRGELIAVAGGETALIAAEIDLDTVKTAQARLPYLRDFRKLNA